VNIKAILPELKAMIPDVRTISPRILLIASTYISAVILLAVLISLWKYGVDLGHVFLGTPWDSPLPFARGEIALAGGIVTITLLFGGLFVGGLMALIKKT